MTHVGSLKGHKHSAMNGYSAKKHRDDQLNQRKQTAMQTDGHSNDWTCRVSHSLRSEHTIRENTAIPQTTPTLSSKTKVTVNKFYSIFQSRVDQSKYNLHRCLDPPTTYITT